MGDDFAGGGERLVKFLREICRAIRYGRREGVYALFGVLCVALAYWVTRVPEPLKLPKTVATWVVVVFVLAGVVCVALSFWRIWRSTIPAPLPEEFRGPDAIKGTEPFREADGELFSRLGREQVLNKMRGWILDDQVPFVAIKGESGVGKTSVLRAGVAHWLRNDDVGIVYWEARPTNPEAELLAAVQARFPEQTHALKEVADLVSFRPEKNLVIVIDQLEQLSPDAHPKFFELFKHVLGQRPPYRTKWIVAFRKEYANTWLNLQISLGDAFTRVRMEKLERFSMEEAERVVGVLIEASAGGIDRKVVAEILQGASRDGTVSPVDIGISLMVLSGLARSKRRRQVTVRDFSMAGGQVGLLTRYLEHCLERCPTQCPDGVISALLQLVDPARQDLRLAEGRSVAEVAHAARRLTEPETRNVFQWLASRQMRVLEQMPPPPAEAEKYRLAHERLIPALRRLSGVILAKAELARMVLDRRFRQWDMDKKRRFLLGGSELRQVLRSRREFDWGEGAEAKRAYVNRSVHRRTWVRAGIVVFLLVVLLGARSGCRGITAEKYRVMLEARGLPRDLYDSQSQLKGLDIMGASVIHASWITADLKSLTVRGPRLKSFTRLPRSLSELALRGSTVESLRGLSKLGNLKFLDLTDCSGLGSLEGLAGLPKLESLILRNCGDLRNLKGMSDLPSLRSLDLTGCLNLESLEGLAGLPKLDSLILRECARLRNLKGMADLSSLRSLDLTGCRNLESLDGLEKVEGLTSLNLVDCGSLTSLKGLEKLKQLGTLSWAPSSEPWDVRDTRSEFQQGPPRVSEGDVQKNLRLLNDLPALNTLNLSGFQRLRDLSGLPELPGLVSLDLSDCEELRTLEGLERLPNLKQLDLSGCLILESIEGLGKLVGLEELKLSGCTGLKGLQGLDTLSNLISLDLSDCDDLKSVKQLPQLPQLTSLNLANCEGLKTLEGLQAFARLEFLDLSACFGLEDIAGLEGLPRLKILSLRGCSRLPDLSRLKTLPNLVSLDISHREQWENLEGLKMQSPLGRLDLTGCSGLKTIEGLGKLAKLGELTLARCGGLTSLAGLEKLGKLTSLDLSGCSGLRSIEGLGEKLPELKSLYVTVSESPQKSLKGLSELTSVTKLLLDVPVTAREIDSLRGLPPKIEELTIRWTGRAVIRLKDLPPSVKVLRLVRGLAAFSEGF